MRAPFVRSLLLAAIAAAPAPAQWVEDHWRTLAEASADQSGDLFGWRLRATGDVDGDGIGDFAVAAPFHDLNQGRVAVFSGATGAEIWARESNTTSEILGFELTTIQDLDGDGARELVSSGPFAGNGGLVYVDSGATGTNLHTFQGFNNQRLLGASLATGGDWDGDGIDDLALGDIGYSGGIGRVFVHSGKNFKLLERIDAPLPTDARFGVASAFMGDTDGDGRDELAIGVRLAGDAPPGRIEVFGSDGTAIAHRLTITGVDLSCALCGDHLDGGRDVDLDGVPDLFLGEENLSRARIFSGADGSQLHLLIGKGSDGLGRGGRLIDDVNGDGHADAISGASADDSGGRDAGRIYVFSGADGTVLETVTHNKRDTQVGDDVDDMGDLNGDGFPELVGSADGAAFVVSRCLASWHLYGAGLAGTLGVPSIALGSAPVLGTSVTLTIGNSLGSSTIAVLLIGLDDAAGALPGGGTILVAPDWIVPLAVPVAGTSLTDVLPDDAALCGLPVHFQAIEVDDGAPRDLSATDGLRAFLGR